MDIVAETLSAGVLRTSDVRVKGQKILDWFESKLSASVSFAGVFASLADAPKKNGAVVIVGSKDYIYQESADKWQEFGDEGQIGSILQAIEQIENSLSGLDALSCLDGLSNYISAETDPVFRSLSGTFLTAHQSLSGYATQEWVNGKGYLTSYTIPSTYKTYANTLTALSGNGYATQKMLQDALGNVEQAINSL